MRISFSPLTENPEFNADGGVLKPPNPSGKENLEEEGCGEMTGEIGLSPSSLSSMLCGRQANNEGDGCNKDAACEGLASEAGREMFIEAFAGELGRDMLLRIAE